MKKYKQVKFNPWNRLGMSLIEVLIALGMVGILSMVIASVMQSMQKAQKQNNVAATLEVMRQNIQRMVQDGLAWNETIADPSADTTGAPGIVGSDPLNKAIANLNCLAIRDGNCPHIAPGVPPGNPAPNSYFDAAPFLDLPVLVDSSGNRFIRTDNAAAGFTDQGAPCTSFVAPPANGDDSCPIRWEFKLQYTCPGAVGPCIDPTVRFIGIVYYNPNANNPMRTIINETKYRVDITRGARGENKSERFEATHQNTILAANVGGGACSPLSWGNINLNNISTNPNASLVGGAVRVTAGTYTCSATTTCFTCGALRLRIMNATGGAEIANSPAALAPEWILATATVDNVTFIANGPTDIRLQHYCEKNPPTGFTHYGMGMALPDYGTPTKFSTLTCTRIF